METSLYFRAVRCAASLAKRPEACANLFREQLWLFPRREVSAFVGLVIIDEIGIRPLCPTPWGLNDLVGKGAHRDRDGDVLRCEEGKLVLPINTRRRDRRVGQPVERDVVEDVLSRETVGLAVEDARSARNCACRGR
jgi:hypothetical protein